MIFHFIKRDLKTNRTLIIFVALTTLLIGFAPVEMRDKILFMFFGFSFLVIGPMGEMLGSQWRGQHQMSRSYLLSLPISRRNLFLSIQLRCLIFGLPAIALVAIAPHFTNQKTQTFLEFHNVSTTYIILVTTGAFFWALNHFIEFGLYTEAFLLLKSQFERLKLILLGIVIYFGEFIIASFLGSQVAYQIEPLLLIPFVWLLAAQRFFRARNKFIGA